MKTDLQDFQTIFFKKFGMRPSELWPLIDSFHRSVQFEILGGRAGYQDSVEDLKKVIKVVELSHFVTPDQKKIVNLIQKNINALTKKTETKDPYAAKRTGGPKPDPFFNRLIFLLAHLLKIDDKIQWNDMLKLLKWHKQNYFAVRPLPELFPSLQITHTSKHLKSRYEHFVKNEKIPSENEIRKILKRFMTLP